MQQVSPDAGSSCLNIFPSVHWNSRLIAVRLPSLKSKEILRFQVCATKIMAINPIFQAGPEGDSVILYFKAGL